MKKNLLLLMTAICLTWNMAYAQTKFVQGTIKYKMSTETDNENIRQASNNTQTIYIKNNKALSELHTGTGLEIKVFYFYATKKVIMQTEDKDGEKIQVNMSDKEYAQFKSKAAPKDYTIEYFTDTKNVAGYNCKKAIVTQDIAGSKANFVIWYTEEMSIDPSLANETIGYDKIKGFPMSSRVDQGGINFTFEIVAIDKNSVDDKIFEVPTGYKVMTLDQYVKSLR